MIFYYFFYDRQPDTGTFIYFFAVQLLEHTKNTFTEMGFKTNSIVPDGNMTIFFFGRKFFDI